MDAFARMVQVIEVGFTRGTGVDNDPVRNVKRYYTPDGELLFEQDPINKKPVGHARGTHDRQGKEIIFSINGAEI